MTDSPSIESQHGHPGIVLATLSLANVMALLDFFVVNVALHDIGVSLHYQSSLSDVAWVLNAYALVFGALLIPPGASPTSTDARRPSSSDWPCSPWPAWPVRLALTCGC